MADQTRLEELPEDWDKALAVAAHPDDLEYGAASAVARWTSQGKHVIYLIVTRGEAGIDSMPPDETGPLRDAEEKKSASIVGVETVEFLNHTDGTIEYGLPLRRDITRAIRRYRPDILVTLNYRLTWDGALLNMADHRWVGLAVLDAARDAGNRWIFPELGEEGLEPWNRVKMVCFSGSPRPTHAVDVTAFLHRGIASLKEHRKYLESLSGSFDPEAFLRESAAGTGKLLGCKFAVSFEVIKI
ncbi:MAG: PIG-L family deacetylase [Proteobacteria bacterium]|nr:PIG-L family deacetylase [Pseudomonadota bacterium]